MAKTGKAIAMKEDERWEAEHDLRTLIDAEKIKNDPKRLKRAMSVRDEQMKALEGMESGS